MGNSHTDGHGQTRTGTDRKRGRWFYLELGTLWRGQNAEVRGQNSEVRGGIEGGARGRCEGVRGQGGL